MKIWVDDCRPAPQGYYWCKSVNETIDFITNHFIMYDASGGKEYYKIELLDLDHDAGDYYSQGGDYIEILDWLEKMKINIPIRIHSMNPVGRANMRRIIEHNNWEQVY